MILQALCTISEAVQLTKVVKIGNINRLPADFGNALSFENFKSVLKTHLFKVAFTDK